MTQLKRFLDEPGSDLDRVLLEAGLDELPPAKSLDRTLAAIGIGSALALGASATATTATATAAGAGVGLSQAGAGGMALAKSGGLLGLSMSKWIGGALLAAGSIGGYVGLRELEANHGAAAPEQGTAMTAVAASSAAAAPALPPARHLDALPSDVAGADSAAPSAASSFAVASSAASASTAPGLPQAAAEPPPRKKGVSGAGPTSAVAPAVAHPKVADAPESASGNGLMAEVALLDNARKALAAGDADGCLARLATYSARFPDGQMSQDAAGMRAAALKKKNATAEGAP